MKDELKKAITVLVDKSVNHFEAGESMKLAQAALNLAHTLAVLLQNKADLNI